MNEARRFLRYVLPGLSTVLLFSVYFWASTPGELKQILQDFLQESALRAILGLFLASGALGYMLSVIHHVLCQCKCPIYEKLRLAVNVTPAITLAMSEKRPLVMVVDPNVPKRRLKPEDLSRTNAWLFKNMIWHTYRGNNASLAEAESRMQSLWDLYHGAGALLIGSIVAFVLWLVVLLRLNFKAESWLGFGAAFVGGIVVSFIFGGSLRQLAFITGSFSENAVLEFLYQERPKGHIVLHYFWQKSRDVQGGVAAAQAGCTNWTIMLSKACSCLA